MMGDPTPLRPASQVVGGFFPVTLAGTEYHLRELPSGPNRAWLASQFAGEVRARLASIKPVQTLDEVVTVIVAGAEAMMDLVISYDRAGAKALGTDPVLPEREWLDTHATDRECYEAMRKVTGIAIPFGPDLVTLVPEFIPALVQAIGQGVAAATVALSMRSTSSSRRSMAGAPTSSSPTSPTPKSRSTPRKPRSAAKRKASPS